MFIYEKESKEQDFMDFYRNYSDCIIDSNFYFVF